MEQPSHYFQVKCLHGREMVIVGLREKLWPCTNLLIHDTDARLMT